jgi:NDP-sugar pyrophosphorylase family protein
VRAVADKLKGDSVVVMSGDTVTDISLPTVLFAHRVRGAAITTVLSKSSTSASAATKAGKAPKVIAALPAIVREPQLPSNHPV